MFAVDESTSIDWAREMRGTASTASAVIGSATSLSTSFGFSPGLSHEMSTAPFESIASSASEGALTVRTIADDQAAFLVTSRAPAAS